MLLIANLSPLSHCADCSMSKPTPEPEEVLANASTKHPQPPVPSLAPTSSSKHGSTSSSASAKCPASGSRCCHGAVSIGRTLTIALLIIVAGALVQLAQDPPFAKVDLSASEYDLVTLRSPRLHGILLQVSQQFRYDSGFANLVEHFRLQLYCSRLH